MTYHIYILYSEKLNHFYIGHTTNLDNRFTKHNNGESPYTSQGIPWSLLWSTTKNSFRLAEALEFKLKNLSRSRKIKFMKKYHEGVVEQDLLVKLSQHSN